MNNFKKILCVLFALSVCLTVSLSLAACNNSGNGGETTTEAAGDKFTYTVTITDADGKPVAGVKLMIYDDASNIFENKTTGNDGKASLELDKENSNLGVMITSVPDGYEKPKSDITFGKNTSITVKLEKPTTETVTYTVKIVDQNGDPVEGVELQICHTVCVQCDLTGADGITKKELSASVSSLTLKVGVLGVPSGYTIPEATVDGGYHATIEPGETEVTVTITKN